MMEFIVSTGFQSSLQRTRDQDQLDRDQLDQLDQVSSHLKMFKHTFPSRSMLG